MRFNLIKSITLLLFSFSATATIAAQSIPDSVVKKIDSLFTKWNTTGSPGCTIGIVRNDSLIYAKGYGQANLEYDIANTPETIFHMASISKQFTATAILLLAKQGKLSLEDDVRKYLPWFPDMKKKITIRNLLNHTSGIRDQWQLLAISGTRLDDVITQEHIVKILGKQQALNFNPGDQYSYSNSGFTMLAEIVKSVSGKSLRRFTDSAIFKPLQMNSTHFHDDYTEIEKNRSYSYERKDSAHFTNSILTYSNSGATSLFTNITDMSKWVMHFDDASSANQDLIRLLTQKGKLNNGKEISYACGIVADTYKGWKQYSHGGADAGYRTYLSVLPDLKMGFIVFSNLGDFDAGGKAYAIADLFVKDTTQKKEVEKKTPRDSAASILKNEPKWKKFAGFYIGDDGLPFSFDIKNHQLFYHIFNESNFLINDRKDSFSIPSAPEIKFVFSVKAKDTICDITTTDQAYHLKKYVKDTVQTDAILRPYTGSYFCAELDCKYGIILKDHRLVLTNAKYNDAMLAFVNRDHLTNDNWWINHLKIIRNTGGIITGFEVNSGRIMHLKFAKIE
ncbi:serine hydrolase domain-containing protein [Ferruginibacter paludis]|uniref:serine hydrolase domain-containing protein n=1 Tax=Ferruginibacter paludis TaxID=1310417 RepID=UPI0025B493EF|nr:serine hydrolase domain-containing protein [Ferruginibacter paludis]MDN3656841.1 serine hydrolase domain-containing protein [Ferruginibacter paludis]